VGGKVKIDWTILFLLLLAAIALGLIFWFLRTTVPLVRLEPQVIYPQALPQKPAERPTAIRSLTATHVWPTLTPGTPTPQVFDYNRWDIEFLARTVACEAGMEPLESQIAVAWVVKTRHELTGKSYVDVLFEEGQFTCWNLEPYSPLAYVRDNYCEVLDTEMCHQILKVAIDVVNGWLYNPCPGATHYYNPAFVEEPAWVKGREPLCVIGAHRFY